LRRSGSYPGSARRLEPGRDVQEHQRKIVLVDGAAEPLERLGLVAEAGVDQRERG
jgi:hypothetical protein